MYKSFYKISTFSISLICLWLLFLLPSQLYKIGPFYEIFPAIDIIIIYYLSTYKTIHYWHLFILGIIVDLLYYMPLGMNSLLFITANIILNYLPRWFMLRDYLSNVIIFYCYSIFIIGGRYIIVSVKSLHYIEYSILAFYLLTTITSYPLLSKLLEKLTINLPHQNAR